MIKQNMRYFNGLFVVIDAILLAIALLVSWYIRIESGLLTVVEGTLSFYQYMFPLIFIIPMYLFLYYFFNLYRPHRTKSIYDEITNVLKANTIGALVFLSYLYIFSVVHYSRLVIVIFYFITTIFALGERLTLRLILRYVRKSHKNLKHIIFVGYSELTMEYSKRIYQNKHWGYHVLGLFDNKTHRHIVNLYKGTAKILGKYSDLETYLLENELDEVVITMPLDEYTELEKIVDICEKQGVYTRLVPDYYRIIPARPYVEEIDGLPVIALRNIPLNDIVKKTFKRVVDIGGALFGLIVLSPMFLTVGVLVKLSSKGPVLFSQKRVGLNRSEFTMYKFRSMVVQTEADEMKGWTKKNDPRVTTIGNFIRKTSLDEFPQLWNVLKGDMSLIGPRPERPQFVEQYRDSIPKYMVKHQVRPGMTGWAQIHGLRGDTSIKKRIEYDLYYIENWTFKMDVKILIKTLTKGFINKNAY